MTCNHRFLARNREIYPIRLLPDSKTQCFFLFCCGKGGVYITPDRPPGAADMFLMLGCNLLQGCGFLLSAASRQCVDFELSKAIPLLGALGGRSIGSFIYKQKKLDFGVREGSHWIDLEISCRNEMVRGHQLGRRQIPGKK